jgi:poly(3-hydroxybutyrate) depolymerase
MQMVHRRARLLVCLATLFAAVPTMAKECAPLAHGSSHIIFSGWSGPELPVFVHKPAMAGANSRVVFVMHGVLRDGDRYRDEWRDHHCRTDLWQEGFSDH